MSLPLKLVVGLGNPGRKYAGMRHNVGYRVIDALADAGISQAILFKPESVYMNESGGPVAHLMKKKGFAAEQVLVVSDDFELPLGTLRLRLKGSSGGHNGLKSILETLGTDQLPRLRVGIGPVPDQVDPKDFVLQVFAPSERSDVEAAIGRAAEAVQAIFQEGWGPAMTRFNGKPT